MKYSYYLIKGIVIYCASRLILPGPGIHLTHLQAKAFEFWSNIKQKYNFCYCVQIMHLLFNFRLKYLPHFQISVSLKKTDSPSAMRLSLVVLHTSLASLSNFLRNTRRATSRATCAITNTNKHTCAVKARSQYQ